MELSLSLVVLTFVLTGVKCLQLSENPPDIMHTCEGSDITLPWTFRQGSQQSITSMEWFFYGRSQEMIAMLSHGMFLPLPAFSGRVEHGSDGTLTIHNLAEEDSGNYTIEINGKGASGLAFTLSNTIYVQVAGNLMTSDHELHVTESPRAVYNDVTQELSLQLSCGRFTYVGQPPFAVEWMSPTGIRYNSSSYGDGQFHWLVPNPVEEGNYTCLVPSRHVDALCLPPGTSQTPEASLAVDDLKVRMMLMEAEQRSLREDNLRLAQNVTVLLHENMQLKGDSQRLVQNVSVLQKDIRQLKADNLNLKLDNQRFTQNISSLRQHITQLEANNPQVTASFQDAQHEQVSFYARMTPSQYLNSSDTVILTTVDSNHGNAYNHTSGVFTAPYNGTYFFIAAVESHYSRDEAVMELVVDGSRVDTAVGHLTHPHPSMATCHAIMPLVQGQRVWLHKVRVSSSYSRYTYFSGFLVAT